jgi:uncharacterized RDD family membrane protein YckC
MNPGEPAYAGLVSRTVALAIDAALLTGGFAVVSAVFGLILSLFTSVEVSSPGAVLSVACVWSLVVSGYFVLSWTVTGETPGMRLMRLRVLDAEGRPPRFVRSVLRLVGAILAAIPFFAGYLLVLVDDRRRGLHDMIAKTTVVHVAMGEHIADREVVDERAYQPAGIDDELRRDALPPGPLSRHRAPEAGGPGP